MVYAPNTKAYLYSPRNGVSVVIAESEIGQRDGIFILFDGMVKK